jgi:putative glutathione S-transferase
LGSPLCTGIWRVKVCTRRWQRFISLSNLGTDIYYEIGWRFATSSESLPGENVTPDPLHSSFTHLRDIYFAQNPDYEGRFTVPTLYDKKADKIVSNESSEIIRMFYYAFDDMLDEEHKGLDLFPEKMRKDIESMNDWVYNDVNNGVYKSGFAT